MIAYSCNTTAAYIALGVGQKDLAKTARTYFGADAPFAFDGGGVQPLSTGLDGGRVPSQALARSGFGQQSILANPLTLAAATAVISRSADPAFASSAIIAPHVVAALCSKPGAKPTPTAPSGKPTTFGARLPITVATTLIAGMRDAVMVGTGTGLKATATSLGRSVVAKTGTAEVAGIQSKTGIDSWVTAIVDRRWVVTILVKGTSASGSNPAVLTLQALLPSIPTASEKETRCIR